MHTDEAVHADKFGQLLEHGQYLYDPDEYHGPTLNYLTLIPAYLSRAKNLTQINEFTLRIVPVFFGVLLVVLLFLITDGMAPAGTVFAAFLTAVSPAMVFYSRYYIQEMLLVCFTFGAIACGYRYSQTRHLYWALLTGAFLGLMHATKETCVIAFACMFLALLLVLWANPRKGSFLSNFFSIVRPSHLLAGLATAIVVSALLYSSFLTNPKGILYSFLTYTTYFGRASHSSLHIHPWHYYLKMLIYSKYTTGPVWTEVLIVLLAVVGLFVVARVKVFTAGANLLRFVAIYTVLMTIVYSAVPYKTPWCLLGFLHGMILLAGVGAAALIRIVHNTSARLIIILILICASLHLAWQGYLGSFKLYADPCNPYVYAHTGTDIFTMVQRVEGIASVHPAGYNMPIHVICPSRDYWPLPWYLRRFQCVGYYEAVTDDVISAAVIIASAGFESELLNRLYQLPPPGQKSLYVPLFDTYLELRPAVELRGYLRKELWDSFQRTARQSPQ
jgi:uncharacterized protein (TIGR03663 family)